MDNKPAYHLALTILAIIAALGAVGIVSAISSATEATANKIEIDCTIYSDGNVLCGVYDYSCPCSYPFGSGASSSLTEILSEIVNYAGFIEKTVDQLDIRILSLNYSIPQTQMQNNTMQ